jgi:hypothetical protein
LGEKVCRPQYRMVVLYQLNFQRVVLKMLGGEHLLRYVHAVQCSAVQCTWTEEFE